MAGEAAGYGWDIPPESKPRKIDRRNALVRLGKSLLAFCVATTAGAGFGGRRADQASHSQHEDARDRRGPTTAGTPPPLSGEIKLIPTPQPTSDLAGAAIEPTPVPRSLRSESEVRRVTPENVKSEVMRRFVPHAKWPTDRKENPKIEEFFPKYLLSGVVVHHTASPNDRTPEQDLTMLTQDGALPYHFVIDRDGNIYPMTDSMMSLPDLIPVGAHATGYNGAKNTRMQVGGSIGIALLGQYEVNPLDLERRGLPTTYIEPTQASLESLALLLAYLRNGYKSDKPLSIMPHRDVKDFLTKQLGGDMVTKLGVLGTQCPGSQIMARWKDILGVQSKLAV